MINTMRKIQANNPIHNCPKENKTNLIKIPKNLYNENYKTLKKEIKKDSRKWKDLPRS
jgi:hypothetical protein